MAELKPCAHCGSRPMLFEDTDIPASNPHRWFIACFACGMRTPKADMRSIVKIWNRRAKTTE